MIVCASVYVREREMYIYKVYVYILYIYNMCVYNIYIDIFLKLGEV